MSEVNRIPLKQIVTVTFTDEHGIEHRQQEEFGPNVTHQEILDRFTQSGGLQLERINLDALYATKLMHRGLTPPAAKRMSYSVEQRCERYGIAPRDLGNTLDALHNIHRTGNQTATYSNDVRRRALTVMLDMYGACPFVDADKTIDQARQTPWVRLIEFSGDISLAVLSGTTVTSTSAAVAYMAGAYAAGQFAAVKTAATTGAVLKGTLLGTVATLGAAGATGLTSVCALGSYAYWESIVSSYRDVWDNEFARDAYLFHRMRDHHDLPHAPRASLCHHADGRWTNWHDELFAWKQGRGNVYN